MSWRIPGHLTRHLSFLVVFAVICLAPQLSHAAYWCESDCDMLASSTSCDCADGTTTTCENADFQCDGWYDTGSPYTCCEGDALCDCQDQEEKDVSDCTSAGGCDVTVIGDRTEKTNCMTCDDLDACTADQCETDRCTFDDICAGTDTSCGCSSCTNCDASDGWYDVGPTYACCSGGDACSTCQDQEYRDYSCSGTSCDYSVTNTRTQRSDCSACGDADSCTDDTCVDGSCQYRSFCSGRDTDCGCSTCTSCDASDGWYNVGTKYDCCVGSDACTCQDEEYRDYACSGTSCTFDVTASNTISSGCSTCDDGNVCTDDSCNSGACENTDNSYSEPCYTGPADTRGVGICSDGTRTCSGGSFGSCTGETTPGTEVCDGTNDENCDGNVDEGCACTDGDTRNCTLQDGVCSGATETCTGGTWPGCDGGDYGGDYESVETSCDGLDNDCDGNVDENLTTLCSLQDGVCAGAVATCTGGSFPTCGSAEYGSDYEVDETSCDGLDNDCDGTPDEGCSCIDGDSRACPRQQGVCAGTMETCSDGTWSGCDYGTDYEVDEVSCDNLDNDCDGTEDENCGCTSGESRNCPLQDGVCAGAMEMCSGGSWPGCSAAEYGGDFETDETTCDGKDNDCDGVVDEGCPCDFGGASLGVCAASSIADSDGMCLEPDDYAVDETTCDGKDNDCDGEIDEGHPNLGMSCTAGSGPCETTGSYVCSSDGTTTECDAVAGTMSPEVCDGADNDCDGEVDEDVTDCADDEICFGDACVKSCVSDADCPMGRCFTSPNRCATGPCVGVQCDAGEVCYGGSCFDACASEADCDDPNKNCILGRCTEDACAGVDCPVDEVCHGGACFPTCQSTCMAPDECIDGRCTPDACANVQCPQNHVCYGGTCFPACNGTGDCTEPLEVCIRGRCTTDPCEGVMCPQGEICHYGTCFATCDSLQECPPGVNCIGSRCTKSACQDVQCPPGETCHSGSCFPDCAQSDQCAEEEEGYCLSGRCTSSPCDGIECPAGTRCHYGGCFPDCDSNDDCEGDRRCIGSRCTTDACADIECPPEQSCYGGSCFIDCETDEDCPDDVKFCIDGRCASDPCANVECASDQMCRAGECVPTCGEDADCESPRTCVDGACVIETCSGDVCLSDAGGGGGNVVQGSEGCTGCATGSRSMPLSVWLGAVVMLFVVVRRRRRSCWRDG